MTIAREELDAIFERAPILAERVRGSDPVSIIASARALIAEMVEAFHALGQRLLQDAAPGVADDFVGAYGAEPAMLWAEVLRQLALRLRSIGLSDLSEASGPAPRRLDPAS